MKTKILYILDNIRQDDCERALARIINGLPRERYGLYLACHKDSEFYKKIDNNVDIMPLDFSKRISLSLIFKLAWIIRKNNIHIVHACGARADLHGRLSGMISGKARHVSTIPAPSEGINTDRIRTKRFRLFARFFNRFVDRFIVSSDLAGKRAEGAGAVNPGKSIRIYNGVDTEWFNPSSADRSRTRAEFNISDNTVLIGAAGRLVWQKGFEFLIKSIPIVIRSHPDVKVLIAGDGPFKEHLVMHSGMLGMNHHVILAGFRNDMKEVLSAVDILVVPSLVDEFPMITLEGMAMAKPVVATRIEGISELITDGENGLLVLSWDANALAKAINRLINDRTFAEILGKKAREKVEKDFSEEKMILETERVYRSLSEGSR